MTCEQSLIYKIAEIKKEIAPHVRERIAEFSRIQKEGNESWFHELCFCILAANTSSAMAWRVQKAVSAKEFLTLPKEALRKKLNQLRTRFYNMRTEYIFEARNHMPLQQTLHKLSIQEKRKFLAKNVKGISFKEASHFLRNIGYLDFAILDKHVINILNEYKIIRQKKPVTIKRYLAIEKKLQKIADRLKITQGELDFYLWYMKTGKVMK
jgi:N-glycosylase/DNA lyase